MNQSGRVTSNRAIVVQTGLVSALLLVFLLISMTASAADKPVTIMIEPGESISPERARAPAFTLDGNNLLIVVDQTRGFFLGRFIPPPGLEPESGSFPTGISLETPDFDQPVIPPTPQTPLLPQDGFPAVLDGACAGSPCVADLDQNGQCEIILATIDGTVQIFNHLGRSATGWPKRIDDGFYAAPSVADLDGDGVAEVVLGGVSGHLYAWHFNGSPVDGWPICPLPNAIHQDSTGFFAHESYFGAAATSDVTGDGRAEVCAASADGVVYLINGTGEVRPGWPQVTPSSEQPANPPGVYSAPNLTDLDGDGDPEILVATNACRIHAWHQNGDAVRGWPVQVTHQARAGYGGITSGDVTGDNERNLVVTSEHGLNGKATVSVYNLQGEMMPGWPYELPEPCNAGAALGDLTGDGVAEIACATIGGNAAVIALDGLTGEVLSGFPLRLKNETVNSSPIIADLDGDGWNDILVSALSTGDDGATWIWAFSSTGGQLPGYPILLPYDEIVQATPVVADLDGDGDLELLAATERLYNLHVWDLESICETDLIPWPGLGGGSSRSGILDSSDRIRNPFDSGNQQSKPDLNLYQGPMLPSDVNLYRSLDLGSDGNQFARDGSLTDTDPQTGGRNQTGGDVSSESLSTVSFELIDDTRVELIIFDIQRQPVRHLLKHQLPPGQYKITWDGKDNNRQPQPSGIFYYRLSLGARVRTAQLLLLK